MSRWKPPASSYWTPAIARDVLTALDRSGASAAQFARTHGLSVQRLRYWRARVATTATTAAPEITFVPIATTSGAPAQIEIALGGVALRLREDVDPEHLARIVAALVRAGAAC